MAVNKDVGEGIGCFLIFLGLLVLLSGLVWVAFKPSCTTVCRENAVRYSLLNLYCSCEVLDVQ